MRNKKSFTKRIEELIRKHSLLCSDLGWVDWDIRISKYSNATKKINESTGKLIEAKEILLMGDKKL